MSATTIPRLLELPQELQIWTHAASPEGTPAWNRDFLVLLSLLDVYRDFGCPLQWFIYVTLLGETEDCNYEFCESEWFESTTQT